MHNLEKIIFYALLVPMGDPSDQDCIWGLPLLLWGEPGIGKSSHIRDAGKALGLCTEPVYPATRQPEDFSGVPVVNQKGELSIECILGAVRSLMMFNEGVLFLDEVSCARPAVQSSLLSVVMDRRIGDTVLPPRIRILLAANPEDSAAGGWELAPPMANRVAHLNVSTPTPEQWLAWLSGTLKKEAFHLGQGENTIRDNWTGAWARASGLIGGFIKRRTELLHKMPEEGSDDRGRAWPSPRTWEFATRAVATCIALQGVKLVTTTSGTKAVDQMAHLFVQACVGEAAAKEWAAWLAAADLPDPEDVLKKGGWRPERKHLDRTYAVLSSTAGYLLGLPRDEQLQLAPAAWKLVDETISAGLPDIALVLARPISVKGLSISCEDQLVQTAAKPVVKRLNDAKVADFV